MPRPSAPQARLADLDRFRLETRASGSTPTLAQLLDTIKVLQVTVRAHEERLHALQAQLDSLSARRSRRAVRGTD
jgi:hypothetical protein